MKGITYITYAQRDGVEKCWHVYAQNDEEAISSVRNDARHFKIKAAILFRLDLDTDTIKRIWAISLVEETFT